jgi:hypothetical protein
MSYVLHVCVLFHVNGWLVFNFLRELVLVYKNWNLKGQLWDWCTSKPGSNLKYYKQRFLPLVHITRRVISIVVCGSFFWKKKVILDIQAFFVLSSFWLCVKAVISERASPDKHIWIFKNCLPKFVFLLMNDFKLNFILCKDVFSLIMMPLINGTETEINHHISRKNDDPEGNKTPTFQVV